MRRWYYSSSFLLLLCSLWVLHPQFVTLNGITVFANCKLSTWLKQSSFSAFDMTSYLFYFVSFGRDYRTVHICETQYTVCLYFEMTLSFFLRVLEGGALRSNYGLTGQILLKVHGIAKPFRWKIPLILFILQQWNLCNYSNQQICNVNHKENKIRVI